MKEKIKVSLNISRDEVKHFKLYPPPDLKITDDEWNQCIQNGGFHIDEYDYWNEEVFAFVLREMKRLLKVKRQQD